MSFQQGLSGLNATSKSLEVIGNNIANAGTYGAKGSRAEFSDMYANALSGAGTNTIGIGVNMAAVAQQFTQGNITITENPMDLAINGTGFFQLTNGAGPPMYSRNGQFKVDREGYIVNNEGLKLLGYPEGTIGGATQPLQLPTAGVEARATTEVDLELKLNSSEDTTNPVVLATRVRDAAQVTADDTAAAAAADPGNTALQEAADNAAAALAAAETALTSAQAADPIDFTDADTYNYTTSVNVYDALGEPVPLVYYYQKTGDNSYDVFVTANGESINVDADGRPQPVTTVVFGGANGVGAPTEPADPVTLDVPATTNREGGTTQPIVGIAVDFSNHRQSAGSEGVTNLSQDGYSQGELSSVIVEDDGTIMARYSNGQSRPAGEIELVTFRNVQGLSPRGNNTWISTFASGTPVPGRPGEGNLGVLQAGALEESNVDLTVELVSMITAQRNYQANAQTIKTVDSVMQTLVNLR